MEHSFAVNWDYRCPFARNAHEHIVAALDGGAPWEVTFNPFSLSQVHVAEGETPVWENPDKAADLTAMEAALVVRDRYPDLFGGIHIALFAARHDQALDLRDRAVVESVLDAGGVPGKEVLAEVESGWPLKAFRAAHDNAVEEHHAFGVPTFVVGDRSVFVRIMTRPQGDTDAARATIGRVLELIDGYPELNEFKYTSLSR
jgi:hypothetical protein